jgi:hypothetical protein
MKTQFLSSREPGSRDTRSPAEDDALTAYEHVIEAEPGLENQKLAAVFQYITEGKGVDVRGKSYGPKSFSAFRKALGRARARRARVKTELSNQ